MRVALEIKLYAVGMWATSKILRSCNCTALVTPARHYMQRRWTSSLIESPTVTVAQGDMIDKHGTPKYKGAQFDKASGRWKAVITVKGKRMNLGTFDDPKLASDAYFAAKSVYASEQYNRKPKQAPATSTPSEVDAERKHYIGVVKDESEEGSRWEAVLTVNGREMSGGEYSSAVEAARAYDALARMYIGADAPTNFPLDSYTSWLPPDAAVPTGHIETKAGVPLTVDEIVAALKAERGVNVSTIDLAGKSDLADHMVFVTGTNVSHMRKMADMLSRALRKRKLPGVDCTVEGREMDDWMVVDAGNIIVNIMDAEAREVFDLENFYSNMKLGEDPYAGMTYDEWLEKNPIPEKWLKRLEKDEMEMENEQRIKAPAKFTDASAGSPMLFHRPRNSR